MGKIQDTSKPFQVVTSDGSHYVVNYHPSRNALTCRRTIAGIDGLGGEQTTYYAIWATFTDAGGVNTITGINDLVDQDLENRISMVLIKPDRNKFITSEIKSIYQPVRYN